MIRRRVFVIAGLGFGDEGKGTIVDFLAGSNAKAVVRYNGGPQAAHHVVLPDGRWHCFSQFASGSFLPEVRSHLAHSMLIKPSNLLVERDLLQQKGVADITSRLTIAPDAYLVTPWDAMLGRMEEVARGASPHGSVGMGVGKAAADRRNKNPHALQMEDLQNLERLSGKLHALWEEKSAAARRIIESRSECGELKDIFQHYQEEVSPAVMYKAYCQAGEILAPNLKSEEQFAAEYLADDADVILEGAQGVLLDYAYGFYPHVTKTTTTFHSAKSFLERAGLDTAARQTVGILRAYGTRHGAGPFVTEDRSYEGSYPEPHNGSHRWQGVFRVGHFDLVASRYAVQVSGIPDYLALTHLDVVGKQQRFFICESYLYKGNSSRAELEEYFELDKAGETWVIKGIRLPLQPSQERQQRLTELLSCCTPHSMVEFSGWGPEKPRSTREFPKELRKLLDYLAAEQRLGRPLKILSFGPTTEDKLWNL